MFIKPKDTALQIQRKLQKAGVTLGFSKNQAVTAEMVRKQFVELVRSLHPDISSAVTVHVVVTRQVQKLDDIRRAKDLLLKHIGDGDA